MHQRAETILSHLLRSPKGQVHLSGRDIGHGQRLIDRGKAAFVSFQTDGHTDNLCIKAV